MTVAQEYETVAQGNAMMPVGNRPEDVTYEISHHLSSDTYELTATFVNSDDNVMYQVGGDDYSSINEAKAALVEKLKTGDYDVADIDRDDDEEEEDDDFFA